MLRPVLISFQLLSRPQKWKFISLSAARVLVNFLDVLGIAGIGLLLAITASQVTENRALSFAGFLAPAELFPESFLLLASGIAMFFILKSLLSAILLRLTTVFLAKVEAENANLLARHLFHGDLSRPESMSEGDMQWAVTYSTRVAFSTMLFAGSALLTEGSLFIFILIGFGIVDSLTALLVVAYFTLVAIGFQWLINRRLKRLGSRMAKISSSLNNRVMDLTRTFREISVLERQDYLLSRFNSDRTRWAQDQGLQRFVMALPRFFVEAALMVGLLGLLLWQFSRGSLSEGLVSTGVFLAGGTRMMAAMLPLQGALTTLRIDGELAKRAQGLVVEARDLTKRSQPTGEYHAPATSGGVGLAVTGVTFCYPDTDVEAIRDINLKIEPGTFFAIVGPSGAGKTTLVDMFLGVRTPTQGTIKLDGQPPRVFRQQHPGRIAYVPQKPGMVLGTLLENICLGIPSEQIDFGRVGRVVEQSGLQTLLQELPEGLETSLGNHVSGLSGGQLQRIGIARALYSGPSFLVLDEATSGLDPVTESGIVETVKELRGSCTVCVIAHRMSTIKDAALVVFLNAGETKAMGSLDSLRQSEPLIADYLRLSGLSDQS